MFKKYLISALFVIVAVFSTMAFAESNNGFNDLVDVDSSALVSIYSKSFATVTNDSTEDVKNIPDDNTFDKVHIASGVPGGTLDQVTVGIHTFLNAGIVLVASDYHGHNWRMY